MTVHRSLLVADRTLAGPELLAVVGDRLSRGPATFWVLVLAVPSAHLVNDFNALSCAFPVDPDLVTGGSDAAAGRSCDDEARTRLVAALARLRALGATADGEVGDPDPLRAVDRVLEQRSFDEVILSTLSVGVSRWLSLDLPHRLRRRTGRPLTVVTAAAGPDGD